MADASAPRPAAPPPEETAAVVTGGGGGLGLAVGRRLQQAGYVVALVVRDEAAAAERAADFESPPAILVADVTDRAAVEAAVAKIAYGLAPPLVLVNAAGVAESSPLLPPDDALWARTLAVNATGTWTMATACLPHMKRAGYGFVCNVASTAALQGYAYTAAYVASKHAVLGLTRALRCDLEGTGVAVTSVCPGFLDTPMTARTIANMVAKTGMTAEQAHEALAAMNTSGRLIAPDEVARAILGQIAAHGEDETLRLD